MDPVCSPGSFAACQELRKDIMERLLKLVWPSVAPTALPHGQQQYRQERPKICQA